MLLVTVFVPVIRASADSLNGATSHHCPVPAVLGPGGYAAGADAGSCVIVAFDPLAVPQPMNFGCGHTVLPGLAPFAHWQMYSKPLLVTLTLFARQSLPYNIEASVLAE